MLIGTGDFVFEWHEPFIDFPYAEDALEGWAHHGLTVMTNGNLLSCHPSHPLLLECDTQGTVIRTVDLPVTEIHGLITVTEAGGESIWIVDNGRKREKKAGYDYVQGSEKARAVKVSRSGDIELELGPPPLKNYASGAFSPTQVAVWSKSDGGNDEIWLADGYGEHQIHCYNSNGDYVSSINSSKSPAGSFNNPHGIWIDTRKAEAELYIADRANAQIQVYSLDGQFKRNFGADFLLKPSAFAPYGDYLLIADLCGRLSVLDLDDALVCHLGDNHQVAREPGWPNRLNLQGQPIRTDRLRAGAFNSPHSVASDAKGSIYVCEWLIGGRFIKLVRTQ